MWICAENRPLQESQEYGRKNIGTINADVNFDNSRNIETKLLRVIEESGYTKEDIEYGVNWAYAGGDSMDLTTILGVILVLAMIAFCGYL